MALDALSTSPSRKRACDGRASENVCGQSSSKRVAGQRRSFEQVIQRAKSRRNRTWPTGTGWTLHGFASLDLEAMCDNILNNVHRVDATLTSSLDFGTTFQDTSTPAVILGATSSWP